MRPPVLFQTPFSISSSSSSSSTSLPLYPNQNINREAQGTGASPRNTGDSPHQARTMIESFTRFTAAEKQEMEEADRAMDKEDLIHYFPTDKPVYSCKECLVPLALQDELVSKAFSGRNGRAYLMHSTVNTKLGKQEERRLLTGLHTVADLSCLSCSTNLGWMYLKAQDKDQEYKEGKYILEAAKVIKENNWSLSDQR